ncbi:MAG: sterol desaturase family protein [Pseudomonadota bacterium]|nr:sterol desaturase family protein [Pseudomonadota bacterium]
MSFSLDNYVIFFSRFAEAANPFAFVVMPTNRFYWLFILGAVVLTALVYLLRDGEPDKRSLRGLFRFCFPRDVYLHRSAIVDYKYAAVNWLVDLLVLGWLFGHMSLIALWVVGGLEAVFGAGGAGMEASLTARVAFTVLIMFAVDTGLFFSHYLEHRIPALWEFHKIHHSAAVLTPLTVLRMHPVDVVVNAWGVGIFVGLVKGVFTYCYADQVSAFSVSELDIGTFVFFLAGYHLRHSHIWLPFPKYIRHVVSSPALHQIHHSDQPRHFDKNFGRILVVWDWVFGTLYVPTEHEGINYGLYEGEHQEYDGVWKLYSLPFKKIARNHVPAWKARFAKPDPGA